VEHIVDPHRDTFDQNKSLERTDGRNKVHRLFKGQKPFAALEFVRFDPLVEFGIDKLRRREVDGRKFGVFESIRFCMPGFSAFDAADKECFYWSSFKMAARSRFSSTKAQ
jgi:hypothetical protein